MHILHKNQKSYKHPGQTKSSLVKKYSPLIASIMLLAGFSGGVLLADYAPAEPLANIQLVAKKCSNKNPELCNMSQCKKAGGKWNTDSARGPVCVFDTDHGGAGCTGSDCDISKGDSEKYDSCKQLESKKDQATCEKQKDALNSKYTSPAQTAKNCGDDPNCEEIYSYLIEVVQILSAVVGFVVVAMIVYGGIEYSSSAGNPEKAASGRRHITNAIFALFAFFFLWAFLNFLIPGGVFHAP